MIRQNRNFQRKGKKKDLFLTKWLRSERDFRLKSRQILLWVVPNATEREIISERDSDRARKINFYRNSVGCSFVWCKKPAECGSNKSPKDLQTPEVSIAKNFGVSKASKSMKSWFCPGTEFKSVACTWQVSTFDVWNVITPRLQSFPKFLWPHLATCAEKLTAVPVLHWIIAHITKQTIIHCFQASISEHKSIRLRND